MKNITKHFVEMVGDVLLGLARGAFVGVVAATIWMSCDLLFSYDDSAMAQTTPFTTFAFPGTGTNNTNRTTPDRIKDIRNVKDYGAVGDASNNDTMAINNAIAAACTDGTTNPSGSNQLGSTVFFPPGDYNVDSQIDLTPGDCDIKMVGSTGKTNTRVYSNIPGATCTCTFDGTGSPLTLTVTAASANEFKPGYYVRGTGVPRSMLIVSQMSGTTNGNGVYVVDINDGSAGVIGPQAMEVVGCTMGRRRGAPTALT